MTISVRLLMKQVSPISDKCEFCGLCVDYDHRLTQQKTAESIDNDFAKLHELKRKGIINTVPSRKVHAGLGSNMLHRTAFCAINSSAWNDKQQKCQYWSLKIKDGNVVDYLAIYHSKRNHITLIVLSVIAITVAIVVAI